MPSPHSKYKWTPAELAFTEKYKQAKATGYPCCLFTDTAELIDAANWDHQVLSLKLKGEAWQQYVADEHIGGVLMWLNDLDMTDPINFEMVTTTLPPRLLYVSWTKQSEGRLSLVIGATVPVGPH